MKVRASVKKRSADCKIVRRKGSFVRHLQKEPEVQTTSGLIINLVKRVKEIYGKNRWCRFALK